jgi:hypothetical protein
MFVCDRKIIQNINIHNKFFNLAKDSPYSMNKKYFIFGFEEAVDLEEMNALQREKAGVLKGADDEINKRSRLKISQKDILKHVERRVVVKVDLAYKNSHTFADGTTIRLERQYNNFNVRETHPVNCIVISGENIQSEAEILVHPHAIHDSNKIFDYKDSNDNVGYYSIPVDMCFAWFDGVGWQPIPPYDFALRVFIPYTGQLADIEPTQLKDTLYVTTGELKGHVVKTLIACDYQIVFQGRDGREGNLIRFRPFGDEKSKREEEALCLLNDITEKVNNGEYYVGITTSDCKPITKVEDFSG